MTVDLPVSDSPDYDREDWLDGLRGLVVTGGQPYILLVLEEPETGGVALTHQGIDPAVIPTVFREIADQLAAA